MARRPVEWTRLLRRQWPVLLAVLAIPVVLSLKAPLVGPLLVATYVVTGGVTWLVWRRWGFRLGRRFVRPRPRQGVVLARLASRPGARDLPAWRVLVMFVAAAAFGFLVANGLAGLLRWAFGLEVDFAAFGAFVVLAMAAVCFLSVAVVPIAWCVAASGVRRVRLDSGKNDRLKAPFWIEHLTAVSGISALVVLATSVKPDATLNPYLDMLLNTLTVVALALPGTLLATLLYVWTDLDGHLAQLEEHLGVQVVGSFFDLRPAAPAPVAPEGPAVPEAAPRA